MKRWHALPIVLGLSAIALTGIFQTLQPAADLPERSLARAETLSPTQNGVGIVFQSEPPVWAADAANVMAALERWRGKAFVRDLHVTFAPARDDGLKGWYDSELQQLVVVEGESDRFGRGVLLHEIFHALQDQIFDLGKIHRDARTPEQDLASRALIEGEAMLAVSELLNYDFAAHARLPETGTLSEETFEKLFLYGAGLEFTRALREAGGWEAVDMAFRDPPRSTALIYHPDRYLAGERELSLPEGSEGESVRGEYGLRLWLARAAETRALAATAGRAYRGDRLSVFTNDRGQLAHRWTIQFADAAIATRVAAAAPAAMPEVAPERLQATVDGDRAIITW